MNLFRTKPKQVDMKLEFARRKSQEQRMLEMFKSKGELTTGDLQAIGTGCSTRLHSLRKEGHVISAIYERPGNWRYVYLGQKNNDDGNAE